jgi:urea transport system permease protein
MTVPLDTLFNGLAIGSVLMLAALGLAVVFGLMGVINMAHGELMMLGAYTTFVVQNLLKNGPLEGLFPAYILLSIPLAFLVSGLAGLLLEKTVIRRLYGRPLETLLATWGVSLILQQFVRSVSSAFFIGLSVAVALGLLAPRLLPQAWWQQQAFCH